MSSNEVKTPLRQVRLRVAVAFTVIMLSSDTINPVKVLCSILSVNTVWVTIAAAVFFLAIISTNASDLIYFMVKTFFHSVLSIFFSSMEVLGKQNIPEHGPVIFTGNHMNQFIDGAVITVTVPRRIGFLVAEKSMKKRIIGDFAKACGAIPVSRPQDKAVAGPGRLYFDGVKVVGEGTLFTQISKGQKIRPGRSPELYRLKQVISDTEAILAEEYGEASPLQEKFCQGVGNWASYDVLAAVDQSKMFDSVHTALASGQCLGIFPEGGSHDRTDLLPLKAGVAAIAFGVQEKFDISVPIVPVGLTYFRGHHFRGRVVVEFGQPIHISKETLKVYGESKRYGYQALLHQIEDGMRSVLVTAPDYAELKLIHTFRRLYQRNATIMSTNAKQDLAKRFSVGFKMMKERFGCKDVSAVGELDGVPADLQLLLRKVQSYQEKLDQWGLRDYQVQHSHLRLKYSKLVYIFLHGAVVLFLSSIPSLILNAPVGIAANYFAYREAKKDLKASRVKLAARDVLLSKKVIFCLAAVPVLWVSYAVLLFAFSKLETRTIVVLLLCCPLFSYVGVTGMQGVMMDLKDLYPSFLRLLPSFQQHAINLPAERMELQRQVREMVRKYGPSLGSVYFDKSDAWEPAAVGGRTGNDQIGSQHTGAPESTTATSSAASTCASFAPLGTEGTVAADSGSAYARHTAGSSQAVGDLERNRADSMEEQMRRVASLDMLASALATTLRAEDDDEGQQSGSPSQKKVA